MGWDIYIYICIYLPTFGSGPTPSVATWCHCWFVEVPRKFLPRSEWPQFWRAGRVFLITRPWNLTYGWWTKSCTTKDDDYPIIYRVLTIPGGAGFCPSTVALVKLARDKTSHEFWKTPKMVVKKSKGNGTPEFRNNQVGEIWSFEQIDIQNDAMFERKYIFQSISESYVRFRGCKYPKYPKFVA